MAIEGRIEPEATLADAITEMTRASVENLTEIMKGDFRRDDTLVAAAAAAVSACTGLWKAVGQHGMLVEPVEYLDREMSIEHLKGWAGKVNANAGEAGRS